MPPVLDQPFPVGVVNKLPSDNVGAGLETIKGFNVAKLLVQVSVVTSVPARLVTAKWLSWPDVSAPIPLEFWLVPVCLNSKKNPLVP